MMIIFFLKNIFTNSYLRIKEMISLAKLQSKYPNCKFYPGAIVSNSIFGNYNVIFNDVLMDSCILGDHSYIQKNAAIFNARIGKFCSIASGVSIGPGIHKMNGVSTHPAFYLKNTPLKKTFSNYDSINSSKTTIIGHDVWIAERAILVDGVSIGTGAIIAAGAVVTKDVEPYAIVGGIPAKHIKYRFEENERKLLLASKWWDLPEEWLMNNYSLFSDIPKFLQKIENK
jgi:acetyltransferase-like isoleucine patch superfamily enzyme